MKKLTIQLLTILFITVLSSCSKTSPAPCEHGGEEVLRGQGDRGVHQPLWQGLDDSLSFPSLRSGVKGYGMHPQQQQQHRVA